MREHGSVFMLMCRSSIYKVLAAIVSMAAVETALFLWALRKWGQAFGFEEIVVRGRLHWVFALTVVLVAALLALPGCEFGSKTGYTLRRLRISERAVLAWQAVFNAGCFFLLWGAQLGIVLVFVRCYLEQAQPEMVSNQSLFLAFYRSGFLHSLLPLEDVPRWIRNGLFLLVMGLTTAGVPYRQRRRSMPLSVAVVVYVAVAFSQRFAPWNDFFGILIAVGVMAGVLNILRDMGGKYDGG